MRHWLVWPDEDFPRTSTQNPNPAHKDACRSHFGEQAGNSQTAANSHADAQRLPDGIPGIFQGNTT